jgi:hypothetical protein
LNNNPNGNSVNPSWRSETPLTTPGTWLTYPSVKWLNKIIPTKATPPTIGDDPAYSHLLNSDSDDLSFDNEKLTVPGIETPERRRPINRLFILFSKTVLVLLALWGIFNIGRWSIHAIWPAKAVSCSCGGTTVAEAKRRGCVFTPLAIAVRPSQQPQLRAADIENPH